MKKALFVFLLLAPLVVLSQTTAKGFTIEGKLDGYADGTKVTLIRNSQQTEWVSAQIQKGKFILKESLNEPELCFIVIDGVQKPIEIYVENAIISVKGNKATPDKYEITGSKSHKDFKEFIDAFLPKAQHLSALGNSINQTAPGAERDNLVKTHGEVEASLQQVIDDFIKNKPKSAVSPFVLEVTYQFKEDVVLLEKRYGLLDAAIKNSEYGKKLEGFIAEKKVGAVGTMALDFTQDDTDGKPVSLSSFRGKYVLVDFWASWCGPCRSENPNVVENYNKFSNKNFTVLGVSLDRPGQKDKWLNAIKEDNLTWTHVSDLQFWNNAAAKLYRVNSIPTNLLVDPSGKIVARNLRGQALQDKLCELLGCN
ncbi:MAG: redoxin domain-containing protein [Bacteroidetes bacterium]|nr:redoxin domain-containing protein [Bacteroidota bacterium]